MLPITFIDPDNEWFYRDSFLLFNSIYTSILKSISECNKSQNEYHEIPMSQGCIYLRKYNNLNILDLIHKGSLYEFSIIGQNDIESGVLGSPKKSLKFYIFNNKFYYLIFDVSTESKYIEITKNELITFYFKCIISRLHKARS